MRKGDLYSQENYYKTLNSFPAPAFGKAPISRYWNGKDSLAYKDSIRKVDLLVQLILANVLATEAGIEASYSAQKQQQQRDRRQRR